MTMIVEGRWVSPSNPLPAAAPTAVNSLQEARTFQIFAKNKPAFTFVVTGKVPLNIDHLVEWLPATIKPMNEAMTPVYVRIDLELRTILTKFLGSAYKHRIEEDGFESVLKDAALDYLSKLPPPSQEAKHSESLKLPKVPAATRSFTPSPTSTHPGKGWEKNIAAFTSTGYSYEEAIKISNFLKTNFQQMTTPERALTPSSEAKAPRTLSSSQSAVFTRTSQFTPRTTNSPGIYRVIQRQDPINPKKMTSSVMVLGSKILGSGMRKTAKAGVIVSDETGKAPPLKVASLDAPVTEPDVRTEMTHEATLLQSVRHIPKLAFPIATTSTAATAASGGNEVLSFIYPLCEKGDLEGYLKALPWNDRLKVALDIAEAIKDLHGKGLVHRDIKPGNIVIFTEQEKKASKKGQGVQIVAKLTDVGFGCQADDMKKLANVCGTPGYFAPEVEQIINSRIFFRYDAQAADIFAFGKTLQVLFTASVRNEARSIPLSLRTLIDFMTKTKPQARVSAEMVFRALQKKH